MFILFLLICSPIIAVILWIVFETIGWLNVGIGFALLMAWTVISIIKNSQKIADDVENQRYNEYIAKLNREVQRPIIQATLAKRENEPIDLGQIIKGKATFTDKNGEAKDLDISVNLKIK